MSIISKLEGRSLRGRLTLAVIIALLVLGGLTTVYPFAVMISGALRSEMDERDLDLVPAFLSDTDVLYRKFLETKYNQNVLSLNRAHVRENYSFKQAAVPDRTGESAALADFQEFLRQAPLPDHWQVLGAIRGFKTVPEKLRELRDRLSDRYHGDLAAFARDSGIPASNWNTITVVPPDWQSRQYDYHATVLYDTYTQLLHEAPPAERQLESLSGCFLELYSKVKRDGDDGNSPSARAFPYEGFHLPRTLPGADRPLLRKYWLQFVQEDLHPSFVVLAGTTDADYQRFLKDRYDTAETLSRSWGQSVARFEDIRLPAGGWLKGTQRKDYEAFLATRPPETYRLVGPEYAWGDWLAAKYGSLDALNRAHKARYAGFDSTPMPVAEMEYQYVASHTGELRRTYAGRNFVNVFRELVLRGRALANTGIFCGLAILTALLINPLAAYGLSRFRLPGTYKILLFLMATMAFPPMVTMIPQFIMLRRLHLLNTMAALVLPFAANGYMIFLLKGFFDSLPQELYEAAAIDGASELRMFFQITMSLSKPILAVVGLRAFTMAYMMFLYPLIVCPRQDMWVLSVWLYQWQSDMSTGPVFASVLVACIPTLIVFIFAQKVIMRGIVVPVEK